MLGTLGSVVHKDSKDGASRDHRRARMPKRPGGFAGAADLAAAVALAGAGDAVWKKAVTLAPPRVGCCRCGAACPRAERRGARAVTAPRLAGLAGTAAGLALGPAGARRRAAVGACGARASGCAGEGSCGEGCSRGRDGSRRIAQAGQQAGAGSFPAQSLFAPWQLRRSWPPARATAAPGTAASQRRRPQAPLAHPAARLRRRRRGRPPRRSQPQTLCRCHRRWQPQTQSPHCPPRRSPKQQPARTARPARRPSQRHACGRRPPQRPPLCAGAPAGEAGRQAGGLGEAERDRQPSLEKSKVREGQPEARKVSTPHEAFPHRHQHPGSSSRSPGNRARCQSRRRGPAQ